MLNRRPIAVALAVIGLFLSAPARAADCAMSEPDRAWLEQALAEWQATEIGVLRLAPQALPQIIAIDAACTYSLPAGDFAAITGAPHGETVIFPDGGEAPVGPISFASGEAGYFAMSLPSVWLAAGVESEVGLERLMTGVLLHEMMHVRQTALAKLALADAIAEAGIPGDELTDDIVQQRFGDDADFVASYTEERDLLFAAAAAPDDDTARMLAFEALEILRDRREGWYDGEDKEFIDFEDVFLTMEGMGQLLIYKYFRSPRGGALSAEAAIKAVRRGGKWWSQDEGLALMLVVDRLLPNWQERAFRDPDWRAYNLLFEAAPPQ